MRTASEFARPLTEQGRAVESNRHTGIGSNSWQHAPGANGAEAMVLRLHAVTSSQGWQTAMQQTMIVSSDQPSVTSAHDGIIVVGTPLEAIIRLEKPERIRTVVLAGAYATNRELATFLSEFYPSLCIACEV